MSIADKLTRIAENEQKVYAAGKKAEHDAFWDAFQQNGTRSNYQNAFYGYGWTDRNFAPKYDIVPRGSASAMFAISCITNLAAILSACNVTLDTSNVTNVNSMFSNVTTICLPPLDFSNATNCNAVFFQANNLETIESINIGTKIVNAANAFTGCSSLKNLTLNGTIVCQGWDFNSSPLLTVESLTSIIHALADYSQDTGGTDWKLTLGSENMAKLTTELLEIAGQKGWSVV